MFHNRTRVHIAATEIIWVVLLLVATLPVWYQMYIYRIQGFQDMDPAVVTLQILLLAFTVIFGLLFDEQIKHALLDQFSSYHKYSTMDSIRRSSRFLMYCAIAVLFLGVYVPNSPFDEITYRLVFGIGEAFMLAAIGRGAAGHAETYKRTREMLEKLLKDIGECKMELLKASESIAFYQSRHQFPLGTVFVFVDTTHGTAILSLCTNCDFIVTYGRGQINGKKFETDATFSFDEVKDGLHYASKELKKLEFIFWLYRHATGI